MLELQSLQTLRHLLNPLGLGQKDLLLLQNPGELTFYFQCLSLLFPAL